MLPEAKAQAPTISTSTQTICFESIKDYRVDWNGTDPLTGTPGSTYDWTLSPAVTGPGLATITTGDGTNYITVDWGTTPAGTYNNALSVIETTSGGCIGTVVNLTIVVTANPAIPTIIINPATCSVAGSATVSNYNATLTYTFNPAGPTVGALGVISGLVEGTSYTLTASSGSCSSGSSASFNIDPQLTLPAVPLIVTNAATCSANGTASVTNYNATLTYTFNPTGPTVGALGVISGLTEGTSYTVTAGNGSCTSGSSASFNIDPQLTLPAVPLIFTNAATCSANGTASVSNYNATLTYTFDPIGPTVGTLGVISGLTAGTSYTVTAGNGSCTSAPSASFNIATQLTTPAIPTILTNAASCSADGTASVSNYNGTLTYTFNPTGPAVGALGVISGLVAGTSYTVNAGNGSCTSAPSASFNIATQLTTPTISIAAGPTCSADLQTWSVDVTVSAGTLSSSAGTVNPTSLNNYTISGIPITTTSITLTSTELGCPGSLSVTAPDCNCLPITAPTADDDSYCFGTSIPALIVTNGPAAGFTLNWYDAATAGNLVGTGTPFTPSAAGTYYAEFVENATSCKSQRTAVTITVTPTPTTSPIFHD